MPKAYKVAGCIFLVSITNIILCPQVCYAAALTINNATTANVPMDPNTNNPLTVTSTGSIITTGVAAVTVNTAGVAGPALAINNFGTIASNLTAILGNNTNVGVTTLTITNGSTGLIGTQGATAINLSNLDPGVQNIVNNAGTVTGGITLRGDGTIATLNISGGNITGAVTSNPGLITVNSTAPNYVSSNFNQFFLTNLNINAGLFTISTGSTVSTATTIANGATLAINTGGQISGAATTTINGNLLIQGGILSTTGLNTIANGATLAINTGGQISGTASTTISGNLLIQGGMFSTTGLNTINGAGVVTVSNGSSINGVAFTGVAGSTINIASSATGTPGLFTNVGNININNGGVVTFGASPTGFSNLTIDNGGSATFSNPLVIPANAKVTDNGSLNVGANNITGGAGSTIEFGADYSTTSLINVPNINITNDAILTLNNGITGTVTNAGTVFSPSTTTAQTITGNYIQTSDGTLQTTITDTTNFSRINVTGNATIAGTIDVNLTNPVGAGILTGQTFNILTAGAPITYDPNTEIQSPLALLQFTRNVNAPPNILQLIAERLTLAQVNMYPALNGVATALDQMFATNTAGPLTNILDTIEGYETVPQIETALAQLAPDVNGGDIMSSIMSQKGAWDVTTYRLNLLRLGVDNYKTGYAAGDMAGCNYTRGPIFFANAISQKTLNGIPGYNAYTGGIGLFVDAPVTIHGRVGAMISYAGTGKKDYGSAKNTLTIDNLQLGVYGNYDIGLFFGELLVSVGNNRYQSRRHINFVTPFLTNTASFNGTQFGTRIRAGMPVQLTWSIEFTPIFSLDYIRLHQNAYKESGSVTALSFASRNVTSLEVGGGIRLADVSEIETYYPEIHLLVLSQTKNPSLQVTSQFIGAGPAFISGIASPFKTSYNFGASFTCVVRENLLLTGSYDMEAKTRFVSHSLAAKLRWLF